MILINAFDFKVHWMSTTKSKTDPTLLDAKKFMKDLTQDDLDAMAARIKVHSIAVRTHDLLYIPAGYLIAEKHTAALSLGLRLCCVHQASSPEPAFGLAYLASLADSVAGQSDVLQLMRAARNALLTDDVKAKYDAAKEGIPSTGALTKAEDSQDGMATPPGTVEAAAPETSGASGKAPPALQVSEKAPPAPAPEAEEEQDANATS